ncbi:MAG TPA: class F sortase [Motilibacterales bacterium]|nr:class F sortase [Motilibacterales bacterium]
MSSQRTSAAALVASLVLVVVSLGAWLRMPATGVGTELDQITLAGASAAGGQGGSAEPVPPSDTSSAASPGSGSLFGEVPVVDATRIVAPEEVAPPRRLVVASVDITMPIQATGVTADGQMELPLDPSQVGWYRFGAPPGDPEGSAVLGGHVDSLRYGTGPLARLAEVRVGARVSVTDADGQRLRYRVTSVQRISKGALPVDRLFDPNGPHRLVIVTCGGRFLPDAGGYEDNIVMIAEPVR